MSDGITDANREIAADKAYTVYIDRLIDHLADNKEESLKSLREAAQEVDRCNKRIAHQTFPGASVAEKLDALLVSLRENNELAWARLLLSSTDHPDSRLRALSPFADCNLISVHQGYGFANYGGDIHSMFSKAMAVASREHADRLGKADNYVGNYLVVVPKNGQHETKAFKLRG